MVDRFWRNLRHDAAFYIASLKVQIRAAMALRAAFILQVLGMVVNNSLLVVAWLLFFERFGTVHGWGMAEFIGFQGVSMLVFGIVSFVSVGLMDLPRHVDSGSLDSFMTKPVSVLGNVASSNVDVTTVGDMLVGAGFLVWYVLHSTPSFTEAALFAAALAAACLVFWSFAMLLPNILAFYLFDSERLARYVGMFFIDMTIYPTGILTGWLRLFLLTLWPGMLVAAVPIDGLRGVRPEWVALALMIGIFWFSLSIWLFKRALRRYESANLIGAR